MRSLIKPEDVVSMLFDQLEHGVEHQQPQARKCAASYIEELCADKVMRDKWIRYVVERVCATAETETDWKLKDAMPFIRRMCNNENWLIQRVTTEFRQYA